MPLEPEASGTEGVDELAKQGILACLKNHDYAAYEYYGEEQYYLDSNVGILNSGVLGVGDKDGEMVYRNVINEESDYQIAEAFPPAGADSILDILNEEPQWEGKLNQAFMALTDALDQIRVVKISEKMLKQNYVEGKTNLSYLLVTDPGKPGEKIMSNAEAGDYLKNNQGSGGRKRSLCNPWNSSGRRKIQSDFCRRQNCFWAPASCRRSYRLHGTVSLAAHGSKCRT